MNSESQKQMELSQENHWWFISRRLNIEVALRKCLGDTRCHDILEIGCGSGGNFGMLTTYGSLIGIEPSTYAAKRSRERLHTLSDVVINQAADDYLISKRGEFTVICAFDVLEHIEDDTATIRLVHQALKPGGLFFISVPLHQWLYGPHDVYLSHHRRYSRKEILAKLADSGFEIVYERSWLFFLLPAFITTRLYQRIYNGRRITYSPPETPFSAINLTLIAICWLERAINSLFKLKIGASLILVCRK